MRLDRALSSTASAPVSTGGCFGCASKLPAIRHDVDALMVHGHGMMMVMMREPPRARAISTIDQHPPVSPALLKVNATFTRRKDRQEADGCEPCSQHAITSTPPTLGATCSFRRITFPPLRETIVERSLTSPDRSDRALQPLNSPAAQGLEDKGPPVRSSVTRLREVTRPTATFEPIGQAI